MVNAISRRDFLHQLMLAGAGLYLLPILSSCGSGNRMEIPEGTGLPPFKTWEEMLYALQFSPDNFPANKDRLVETGDPNAMFHFVRDELTLLPSDKQYFRYIESGTMYGLEGALRTGMATPREKAELLKNMLLEAGFEARVVTEHVELTEERVKDILFKKTEVGFSLPVGDRQYRNWRKELGATDENGSFNALEDGVEEAKKLARSLLEKTEPKHRKEDTEHTFYFSNRNVPGVALKQDGKEVVLHLFDPSVEYGKMHPTNKRQEVYNASDYKEKDFDVTLTLKATTSSNMREEIELLSATYKASELVGNQLKLQFLNNMSFEDQATQTIASITTFTPSIALQDLDKNAEYLQKRSYLGEPITLEGKKVFEEVTRFSEQNGQGKRAGDIKDVAALKIKAKPRVYPSVELQLFPTDAEGKLVEGLNANNFKISDNNKTVRALLRKNVLAPKILLIYDTSGSMPSEYRGEGIKKFLERTQTAVREAYPNAVIKLMDTGSNIYTTHLKAAQTNNDLVVYATDGHNNDTYNPKYKAIYDAGPPTIYLNVYEEPAFFDYIKENIDIIEVPASDQEQTIVEIQKILGNIELAPYVFSYNSFEQGKMHKAKASLLKTPIESTATYTFPEGTDEAVGMRMVGLYLYIKVGNQYEKRRVLAGYDYEKEYYAKPSKQMANEVHEVMLGSMTLAFEKAGATTSVRFSEYLQTLLSTRNWMEPYLKGNNETALENVKKGGFDYPSALLSLMQPIDGSVNQESATYVQGLRIGLLKFKPALFSEKSSLSFDYLRTSQYRTLTKSGTGWFRANAQKTAQLALLEAKLFPVSTYSVLRDRTLQFSEAKGIAEVYTSELLKGDYRYWREYVFRGGNLNFFDESAEEKAFWNIDHYHGEMYGILPDMTGGGGESIEAQLQGLQDVVKDYQQVIAGMNLGMMAAGGGGALGVVAAYSVTLVELYALASEAIIIMDASGMDEGVAEALQALACNIYKEILYMGLGPAGTGASVVENLIGMMGGSYSFVKC